VCDLRTKGVDLRDPVTRQLTDRSTLDSVSAKPTDLPAGIKSSEAPPDSPIGLKRD